MPKKITSYIPDAITLMNLLSGCVAIFMAFNFSSTFGALTGAQWSIVAIAAAAFFDFCDGASARALHAYSDFGKDLDSLSDLVSFGVAPAILTLNLMLANGSPVWSCLFLLFIPACGALRLAKFNNDTEQSTVFRGLPIPANAIFWIGVYGWVTSYTYPGWAVIAVLAVIISLAMTGNFKMFSLKFKNFDFAENFCRYIVILGALGFVALYGLAGLMWTILLYFLLSILRRKRI